MPLVRYQLNNIASTPNENSTLFWEVSRSMSYATGLILAGCLTGAYLIFNYLTSNNLLTTVNDKSGVNVYLAMGAYTLPLLVFYAAKKQLMKVTAILFFSRDTYNLADMEQLFFMAVQAMLMTSLALAHAFYGFNIISAAKIAIGGLITTELLAFYKNCRIFSKGNVKFSHFFCTFAPLKRYRSLY
jgi:hypothetical protein